MSATPDASPPGPRLPPRRSDDDPRLADLFAKGLAGPTGEPLNVFGTLAHHPDLLRRWLPFAGHVLSKSSLSPRHREILILRTGWRCQSVYEFSQHARIGLEVGLTPDEIEACKCDQPSACGLGPIDHLLICATDELLDWSTICDHTWKALAQHFDPPQLLDVIATVGNYRFVSTLLNALAVELDHGVDDALTAPVSGSVAAEQSAT